MARQPASAATSRRASSRRSVIGGVRGLTSNPSIFQKAIQGSPDYDEQFGDLVDATSIRSIDDYWAMVLQRHPRRVRRVLDGCTTSRDGVDGYVASRSLRASPTTARAPRRPPATCTSGINRRNLMVKIPGTEEGLAPIQQMIAEGRNINVTLIFSLERYADRDGGLHRRARSVRRAIPTPTCPGGERGELLHQPGRRRGRSATRSDRHRRGAGAARQGRASPRAKLAYQQFTEHVQRPALGRVWRLAAPRVQRPLWASTGDQEPRLPRHAVRRRADRPAHGEHAARHDARSVRRPRHARPHVSTPMSTRPERSGRRSPRSASTWTMSLRNSNARASTSSSKSFDELIDSARDQGLRTPLSETRP